MYHYSNNHVQQMYHNREYPPCVFVDSSPHQTNDVSVSGKLDQILIPRHNASISTGNTQCSSENASKHAKNTNFKEKLVRNGGIDTSNFSIEERLVSAVWVHERKTTGSSINQIKRDFRQRFKREPPTKNTLLVWERKLFASGSVCDAPRSGRPTSRRSYHERVSRSVQAEPSLSVRARAAALRLPRSTLRNILRQDLRYLTASHDDPDPDPDRTPGSNHTGGTSTRVPGSHESEAPATRARPSPARGRRRRAASAAADPHPAPPPPAPPPSFCCLTHSHPTLNYGCGSL